MLSFTFGSVSNIFEIILKDLADSHGYDIAAVFGINIQCYTPSFALFFITKRWMVLILICLPFIVFYCFLLRILVVSFMLIHCIYCK